MRGFFKAVVVSVCLVAGLAMTVSATGCGNDGRDHAKKNQSNPEEIAQAVSDVVDFLETVKEGGNYYSFSVFADGGTYEYYADGVKVKMRTDQVFYAVKEGATLYKISQAEDMTWHKTADTTDLSDPKSRIANLINGTHNTTKAALWTNYDSKTKTLTATYSDGTSTITLDAGVFVITYNTRSGTTKHTIRDVGDTVVTLPENIIDDTQN